MWSCLARVAPCCPSTPSRAPLASTAPSNSRPRPSKVSDVQDALHQVEEFHATFKLNLASKPTADVPANVIAMRVRLLQEELDEYREAAEAGDIVAIADALTDLAYVLFGTYVTHGLQAIAVDLFNEIHRSNMSKLDANGLPIYREDGKVIKSELFSA